MFNWMFGSKTKFELAMDNANHTFAAIRTIMALLTVVLQLIILVHVV